MTTVTHIFYFDGEKAECNLPTWKCFDKFTSDKNAYKMCMYTSEGVCTYEKNKDGTIKLESSSE